METIVLPSEDRFAQHQLQSNWAMAGMISPSLRFSRSRRTRHPSSLIKWSVVSPQASESVHNPSSELSNPSSPPAAVVLPHFSPRSFYSLGCQAFILSRTTSLPASFHDSSTAEGECNRVYPSTSMGSHPSVPKQFADNHSNSSIRDLAKRTQLTKSFSHGTSDTASLIDKENDSIENYKVGQGKLVPPRTAHQKQNADKLADRFQMQANLQNVSPPQHNLRRAMSIPRNGNRTRTAPAARTISCREITEDEKWAGPAYSKSPPPSSLPFPKFSVQPMRSLSMDMALEIDSPSGTTTPNGLPSSSEQLLCNSWDATFATKDLKRILNLDQELAM